MAQPHELQQTIETIRENLNNFYDRQFTATAAEVEANHAAYFKEVGRKNKIRMINAWRKKNPKR
jgi:hypothetical protein